MTTDLILKTTVAELAGYRDAAMKTAIEGAQTLAAGHAFMEEAHALARMAYGASSFTLADHTGRKDYQRLFEDIDATASIEAFRKVLDARTWTHVLTLTGLDKLMDRTAREKFDKELATDVPVFTEEAAYQVFGDMAEDAGLIFQRGLAVAFSALDRRFKSHDGFKIGSRIILTRVFDQWGSFSYHSGMRETMADVERVFAVLDKKTPDPGALLRAIEEDRRGKGYGARQSVTETPYFRIRCFQNGNAHLWMLRDDLVEKANLTLADYYGSVIPDGVPHGGAAPVISGVPAKDLSFYPTPAPVVKEALDLLAREITVKGTLVLEPSAGTGALVRGLLAQGAKVDAIEIHPERAQVLRGIKGDVHILECNFLDRVPSAVYGAAVMNPPFYGTHWMDHVQHAWSFLAPGGTLVAILPASANSSESPKHAAFWTWAAKQARYGRPYFHDLPPESFAASGTRINTGILVMQKAR